MKNNLTFLRIAWFIAVAAAFFPTQAQNAPQSPIESLLDKPARVELVNTTLEDTFRQLEASSGLRFDLHQAQPGIELLPYGDLTQITATLQGITWRQALRELLKPLSLEYQAGRDEIFILPTPWLLHQPMRMNREELDALVQLQTVRLTNKDDNLSKRLQEVTGGKKFVFFFKDRPLKEDNDVAEKILTSAPQPAAAVLDLYARRVVEDGCWYLRSAKSGGEGAPIEIVMLHRRELTAMKCQKRISQQYPQIPLQDILRDMARLAGLKIHFEPGCIDMVDENTRLKSGLVVRACTIENALETIAGMTGLAYAYGPDSLNITASDNLKAAAQARLQGVKNINPTLGAITVNIPGTDLKTEISIRQQYLEEQGVLDRYLQLRQDSLADLIEYLRNYKPAHPPAAPAAPAPPSAPAPPPASPATP
jgi:hypothetical protein